MSEMDEMLSQVINSTGRFMANPRLAEDHATYVRNYFDALVAKGFTRDEALQIVIGHGLPGK